MSEFEVCVNAICEVLVASNEKDRQKAKDNLKAFLEKQASKSADAEMIIRDMFLEMSVPDHLIGYEYAITAILLCLEDRAYLDSMPRLLYPEVAKRCNSSSVNTERAIRHLIEETFERGDRSSIERYFGNLIRAGSGKVTNSEFFGRMANIVRKKMRS